MTNDVVAGKRVHVNKRLLMAGAGLMAVGGVIGFAGMAVGGAALFVAARQWVRQMEVSPRELAAMRWRQAREATLAGARAWHESAPTGVS